mmetsp:Transcript_14265/g.29196  ORF Transcript_14265/g.29196 Transcript_14265/m.29196 type:complete len:363 (-) Transcript_14265:408-1496(-)
MSSQDDVTVLVNRKSGGQKGDAILSEFQAVLGMERVFSIVDVGPGPGLERAWKVYEDAKGEVPFVRVIVAGGDGTVDWVLGFMEEKLTKEMAKVMALMHLPLGTGNDMARATGWGGGYDGGDPEGVLRDVLAAEPLTLDRWKLTMTPRKGDRGQEGEGAEIPAGEQVKVFANYMSIGADAAVAYNFHHLREEKPHLFKGRLVNKFWYGTSGLKATFRGQVFRLRGGVSIIVDGEEVRLPRRIRTIVLLNIPSYMGGSDIWGAKKKKVAPFCMSGEEYELQSSGDQKIELVGFGGPTHQASVAMFHRKGIRLAQGTKVHFSFETIRRNDESYAQVDGEPWLQRGEYEATVEPCARALMLVKRR